MRGAPDPNPVLASSLLINGYVEQRRVGWDFEDESPGRDARGFARDGSQPPEIETHLVNAVLTNGARYYVDHAHPEYSTPECSDPLQLVLYDKAGERILARSMDAARRLLPAGQEIVVYKNNSDGKGNSYGCHENYLVDRNVPFAMLVRNLMPWFVTRQVFTGAGKVGAENGADAVDYQISQRADFFEEEVGLETTLKRPIVNTRDEPHADPQKYRRLHVIVGDANLCEVATFLKVGTTAIVLAMVEDGFIDKDLSIATPGALDAHGVARPVVPRDGRVADLGRCTAIELQWEFLRLARKYADETGLEACGGDEIGGQVLDRWEQTLAALERDPFELDGQLDWVTKWNLLRAYVDRDDLELGRPQARAARPAVPRRPPGPIAVRAAGAVGQGRTPVDRGRRVRSHGRTAAHDPGLFPGPLPRRVGRFRRRGQLGQPRPRRRLDPLRRIPMMEPMRGSKKHVEQLFAEVSTPPASSSSGWRQRRRSPMPERERKQKPAPKEREKRSSRTSPRPPSAARS